VERNGRLQVRTLNFNCDFLTSVQPRTINLSERSRRDRLGIDFLVRFVQTAPQLRFNDRESLRGRKRRHLVLQLRQLFHVLERQQIGTRAERLADLDERWSKVDQRLAQPHSLLLQSLLFLRRTFFTTKHEVAPRAHKTIKRRVELYG